jgi:hypothetical protein
MILRVLLAAHALVTLAAAVLLVVAPEVIPSFIGVDLAPGTFVVCYLLAGAEFSIAFLSLYGVRCRAAESLRVVVLTILIFHVSTAALEILALMQGIDPRLWSNVGLRAVVIAVFFYYGVVRLSRDQPRSSSHPVSDSRKSA